jgi:hypothetical protein
VSISLQGYEALVRKLTTLAQLKSMAAAVNAAAVHVKRKIATYPARVLGMPNPNLYGNSAKAAKMRRGFFARLREGKIDVPYRRGASPGSKTLGKKWNISTANAGLTATVGNNVSYGPLVQSDAKQTAYHAAVGWKTVEEVAEDERETVTDLLAQELERIVGGA